MFDFWRAMRRAAEAIREAPSWTKAGINLTERHFETFRPSQESIMTDKLTPPERLTLHFFASAPSTAAPIYISDLGAPHAAQPFDVVRADLYEATQKELEALKREVQEAQLQARAAVAELGVAKAETASVWMHARAVAGAADRMRAHEKAQDELVRALRKELDEMKMKLAELTRMGETRPERDQSVDAAPGAKVLGDEQERDCRSIGPEDSRYWGNPDWRRTWVTRIWATLDDVRRELFEMALRAKKAESALEAATARAEKAERHAEGARQTAASHLTAWIVKNSLLEQRDAEIADLRKGLAAVLRERAEEKEAACATLRAVDETRVKVRKVVAEMREEAEGQAGVPMRWLRDWADDVAASIGDKSLAALIADRSSNTTESKPKTEPDKDCVTAPDGGCIAVGECMHTAAAADLKHGGTWAAAGRNIIWNSSVGGLQIAHAVVHETSSAEVLVRLLNAGEQLEATRTKLQKIVVGMRDRAHEYAEEGAGADAILYELRSFADDIAWAIGGAV